MADTTPTPAEELLVALMSALVQKGVLVDQDVLDIAGALEDSAAGEPEDIAERLEAAADLARCSLLEAEAPSQEEFNAEQARSRFRLVKNEDS